MSNASSGITKNKNSQSASSKCQRPRWLEALCFLVLGFCLRTTYDLWGGFRNGIFQEFLEACAPLEIKGSEYSPHGSGPIEVSTTFYRNNNNSLSTLRPLNENGLEFIFTIGLEGTGHHFMDTIIKASPAQITTRKWGLLDIVGKTILALFDVKNLNGLWNQACQDDTMYIKQGKTWKLSYKYKNKVPAGFNTVNAHNRVVKLLQTMQRIYNEKTVNSPQPLRIPLNSYSSKGIGGAGMISYPNFRGKCSMLHYPVLELLYNACDDAGVQCSHIYVYRHPLDVLKSTTVKRSFNPPGMMYATHLYTSHLKIMETQLMSYPDRNRGCFGFFDRDGSEQWQSTMRDMWGWTFNNQTNSFATFVRDKYRKPKQFFHSTSYNIIAKELNGIVPAEHIPYLEVLLKAHEQTLEVCRQTAQGRQKSEKKRLDLESI